MNRRSPCSAASTWLLLLLVAAVSLGPQLARAATRTVTNPNDCWAGSLRDLIASSDPGDTIDFAVSGTITLTCGELLIDKDLTITGPPGGLTIGSAYRNRVLNVRAGTVNISNLTICEGYVVGAPGIDGTAFNLDGGAGGAGRGGGIFNNGLLTLVNCTLSSNFAQGGPGGDCYSFLAGGNGGRGGDAGGGAIFNQGMLTLRNCTVSTNVVDGGKGGAGALLVGGIDGDGGNANGGGICNVFPGSVSMVNCTVTANIAYAGNPWEAGDCPPDPPEWSECRLFGHWGIASGGGLFQETTSSLRYTSTLINTIVAFNEVRTFTIPPQGGSFLGPDLVGTFLSSGHNLIGQTDGSTGWQASDLTGASLDPLLGPLQNNGGPTMTRKPLPGSPAIDAGNDVVLGPSFNLSTDQRGCPRRAGEHVDIGAVEIGSLNRIVTTTNDSGPGSLREAVAYAASGCFETATIGFASNVTGTITLTTGELAFGKNLNILGPGAKVLTVSGNNASRIFHVTGGASQISGLRIANGRVVDGGGGIALEGSSSLMLSRCAVTNCYAAGQGPGPAAGGGGIYVGPVTLSSQPTLTLTDSTLSGNSSAYYGGGLMLFNGATVSLVNCTVSGNRTLEGDFDAGFGGGIFVQSSTLNVTSSTIASNSTAAKGGGIYRLNGTVSVRNSLVAGNHAEGTGSDCQGTFVSHGYNLIGNTSGSTGFGATGDQLNLDPLIDSLADNGGPTLTHTPRPGSPAIDRGIGNGLTTDQRGRSRAHDFPSVPNAPGGDGSDIGAVEFNPLVLHIARAGSNVRLWWEAFEPYSLWAVDSLDPCSIECPVWFPVGAATLVGDQAVFTESAASPKRFYQLRSP